MSPSPQQPPHRPTMETALLLEALASGRCPVCYAETRAAYRHLDSLLYEQVTDPSTRRQFRRSGGLCRLHGQQARQSMNPLGMAILYGDLLEEALKGLQELEHAGRLELPDLLPEPHDHDHTDDAGHAAGRPRRARRGALSLPQALLPPGRRGKPEAKPQSPVPNEPLCSACKAAREAARSAMLELVQAVGAGHSDVLTALEASPYGLCYPHLVETARQARSREAARRLLRLHRSLYEGLAERTRRFIESSDYRRSAETPPPDIATAWRQAVEACNGGPLVLQDRDISWRRLHR